MAAAENFGEEINSEMEAYGTIGLLEGEVEWRRRRLRKVLDAILRGIMNGDEIKRGRGDGGVQRWELKKKDVEGSL